MDKLDKHHRVKSESSDEEEDFESADEGDDGKRTRPPPSLMATSPYDGENSSVERQVTKDSRSNNSCNMAETQDKSNIPSELCQEDKKHEKLSENSAADSNADSLAENTESTSTSIKGISEECSSNTSPTQVQEALEKEVKTLDDSIDDEIQFKSDKKDNEELVAAELETNQIREPVGPDTTTEHKETIEKDAVDTQRETECTDEKPSNVEEEEKASKDNVSVHNPESSGQPGKEQQQAKQDSSWGWGGWGSMLSQASAGLSSVIETVESTLGIPDPEEFAKKVHEDAKTEQAMETVILDEPTVPETQAAVDETGKAVVQPGDGQGLYFSLFGVPGLSSVVSEGLGALEYIGKKTMDVISEGDPGLRNTREQLMPKGPTLSQMLREAKEQAEYKAAHPDYKESTMNVRLTTEFDKYQGLAHLEALEILSKESEIKVEDHIINLNKDELMSIKPLLRTIQDIVQIEDEVDDDEEEQQDFESEIVTCLAELNLTHIPNKTKSVHTKAKEWIDSCLKDQTEDPKCKSHVDIYSAAIATLAELTACSVEQFHKIAEVMLLLAEGSDTSALVRAQTLKKITVCVCQEVSTLASLYAAALSNLSKESEDSEAVESLITTLYLESSDSSRYVQHAFKLMCPVLQQSSLSETSRTKCR